MKVFSYKTHMLSKKYLGLLTVLVAGGIGTVYAGTDYTEMEGSYNITDNLLVNGNLTGPTITEFDKRVSVLELRSSTVVTSSSTLLVEAIYELNQRVLALENPPQN